ncbi:hypothetical protein COCON_G00228150 [Conger conger]|uniref:Uncharacterized protein n=1 Tax=Conger conger TaxID=82655 RepID=A0A9Q1CUQ1_CONCO|nr:hypothetical protein COCON_G00228150 [Conger conger]
MRSARSSGRERTDRLLAFEGGYDVLRFWKLIYPNHALAASPLQKTKAWLARLPTSFLVSLEAGRNVLLPSRHFPRSVSIQNASKPRFGVREGEARDERAPTTPSSHCPGSKRDYPSTTAQISIQTRLGSE